MHEIVLKNGLLVDVLNENIQKADIKIENDKIVEISTEPLTAEDEIECSGMFVSPGLIDIHTHLREPGFEHKETIETGAMAAAAGGFTRIYAMPNTEPPCDDEATALYIRQQGISAGLIEIEPVGSISKGRNGEHLAEMGGLAKAGVKMVTDDGNPVESASLLLLALKYSKAFGLLIADHCEDKSLSANGVCSEGYFSTLYGLQPIPLSAEETMVSRDIILASETKSRIHIMHVSTAWAIGLIREAKKIGVAVTCEVTPHHLTLTDEMLGSYSTNCKVSPPLRSKNDVDVLRKAINDGTIDCIATDHAPHAREDKEVEINIAPAGISGLETAVAQLFTELVHPGFISTPKLLYLMSMGPAKVVGLEPPVISVGSKANLTVIDPNSEWIVQSSKFFSLGKNTPLEGKKMKGKVYTTICSGKVVYKGGKIIKNI